MREKINIQKAECLISSPLNAIKKLQNYLFFPIHICEKIKKTVTLGHESSKWHPDSLPQHNRQLRSYLQLHLIEFCNAVSQCHFLLLHLNPVAYYLKIPVRLLRGDFQFCPLLAFHNLSLYYLSSMLQAKLSAQLIQGCCLSKRVIPPNHNTFLPFYIMQ